MCIRKSIFHIIFMACFLTSAYGSWTFGGGGFNMSRGFSLAVSPSPEDRLHKLVNEWYIGADAYEAVGAQRFHLPTRAERDEWTRDKATLSRRITGLEEVEEALTCQRDELQGRVIAMIQQVEVCEQLAAIVAAQVHEADPSYTPPANLHDPEVLKELLERAQSLKLPPPRAAEEHEAWDDDFVRISSSQDGA